MGGGGQIEFHGLPGIPWHTQTPSVSKNSSGKLRIRARVCWRDKGLTGSHVVEPAARGVRAAEPHPKRVRPARRAPIEEIAVGVAWYRLDGFRSEERNGFRRWIGRKGRGENVARDDDRIRRMLLDRRQRRLERCSIAFAVRNETDSL